MKCNSKDCMYYVYDECIRTDIVISSGICKYYNAKDLTAADIMHYNVIGNWYLQFPKGSAVEYGHVLDVCAKHYDKDYIIVSPSEQMVQAQDSYSPQVIDMTLYLRFMDSRIQGMYMEDFLLTYLEDSVYHIDRIDCNGHYIHVKAHY